MDKFIKSLILLLVLVNLVGCEEVDLDVKEYESVAGFIENIESLEVYQRAKYIDNEIVNIINNYSIPEVKGDKVLFIYNDKKAKSVEIVGDLNRWNRPGMHLKQIKGTSFFYLKVNLEKNARLKYRFIINQNQEILDPLNPKQETGGFGTDSLLEMYEYSYPATEYYQDIPHGQLIVKEIDNTTIFGDPSDKRKVQIYLPPNYDAKKEYKTIYFCDGTEYVEKSKIPNVLDYMIDREELESIIAVFISYLERDKEYILSTKEHYLNFLIDELIPMIEEEFSAQSNADSRIIIGPSNGGDFVIYAGVEYPDKFKYIFNQSGGPQYFYNRGRGEDFGRRYKTEHLPIKVISIVGKYERVYNINNVKRFHRDLENNPSILGEKLIFYPQGHTYRMWGDSFREGILWLLYDKKIN